MTHASLFSGIGGAEVAATMMGWENIFHCEINPFCRRVLEYWYPNSKSYEDITKTNFEEWRGKVDVLTGGFPCQPFSHAGERRGAEDDRYLWDAMLRAIQECRPTWIVGENVIGITTMVEPGSIVEVGNQASLFGKEDNIQSYESREQYTTERICGDLESIGYSVQPIVIPACAVGAPHRRERVFFLAKDSVCMGLQGEVAERQHTAFERNIGSKSRDGKVGSLLDHMQLTRGRWENFPTISSLHRGNDGIPFDVDGLTIPFERWRKESLKAYGNAIVPQVMYEIFLAIDQVEQSNTKQV